MSPTVTVGLDGSSESRAAAEWAAREARLRGLPLRLVNVWEPAPTPMALAPLVGVEAQQKWPERLLREATEGLRLRHPGVEVVAEQLTGRPGEVLTEAAEEAELLVLGSRGLSGIGGFLVGSVGQAVVARTERPVVLVRAGEAAADEHVMDPAGIPSAATWYRPVVLGLDTGHPHEAVIEFAIDAAMRRATTLRVVHGFTLPPYLAYGLPDDPELNALIAAERASALTEVLRPWRQKHPSLEIVATSRAGKAADQLVAASDDASLVVVGRRIRRSPFGAHIGPVTHAVLHHVAGPVAVVPHD
ncbi:universal stress protein [Streptomyces deccanensis]|uniref:universal stress protein n=1 Tax=Streptomyces deccanensis TaxID=424188 RepID=UPI001EFC03E8|nr:universal stress protein [Streptomyces deccanensis]ULR48970.1 universal stress protein [Streptomyces deccanensis]